ncbi:MAG: hypothetical protein NC305_19030 [Lachnospiraceae bacterium]|nr:hypothetical protein [Lachnospiraceae bacterium]
MFGYDREITDEMAEWLIANGYVSRRDIETCDRYDVSLIIDCYHILHDKKYFVYSEMAGSESGGLIFDPVVGYLKTMTAAGREELERNPLWINEGRMGKYHICDRVKVTNGRYRDGTGVVAGVLEQDGGNGYDYHVIGLNQSFHLYVKEEDIEPAQPSEKSGWFTKYISESGRPDREIKFRPGDVVRVDGPAYEAGEYAVREAVLYATGTEDVCVYVISPISALDSACQDKEYLCTESELELICHDDTWENYYTEPVRRELTAWRGKPYNFFSLYENPNSEYPVIDENRMEKYYSCTIPPEYMENILRNHSFRYRMDDILASAYNVDVAVKKLGIGGKYVVTKFLKESILEKISLINRKDIGVLRDYELRNFDDRSKFDISERELTEQIMVLDKKGLYPILMNDREIMEAIKEAYKTARRTGIKVMQAAEDRRMQSIKVINLKNGQRLYRGESETYHMTIEFWFDLDMQIITSAYPVAIHKNGRG